MRKAILYIRVSTDEQAEKGYSLQHQEERLRNYCAIQNIEVLKLFKEDYSAKTFNRPEFNKLLDYVRQNKNTTNLLLFLKWDRFSRNIAESYEMINRLNRIGIEPQGIEQPLDLRIPENKLMLAYYLAAPEVENDRRALNVIAGMRRARRDGRWMGSAPFGYDNKHDNDNKPMIMPNDKAEIVIAAFKEIEKGLMNVSEIFVWLKKKKGYKGSLNTLWYIIKNPVYCGRIFIPAYRDEPAETVKGKYPAIISEELFNEVQDVINGRRKNFKKKIHPDENLPMRGFLICKSCGRHLTGSRSRGRGGYYYYYHCKFECKERYKAEDVNLALLKTLQDIKANANVMSLYKQILFEKMKQQKTQKPIEKEQLTQQIIKYENRLSNAKEDWLDRKISAEDYSEIKNEITLKISLLNKEKDANTFQESESKKMVNELLRYLENVDEMYTSGDLNLKQQIIGSTFPEKTIFFENQMSNHYLNPAITFIRATGKEFKTAKNKNGVIKLLHSSKVGATGVEPVTLCL